MPSWSSGPCSEWMLNEMQVCWVIKAGSHQPTSKPWASCAKVTCSVARSSERKPPRSFLLRSKATPVALMLAHRIYDIITEKEEWRGSDKKRAPQSQNVRARRRLRGPEQPGPCQSVPWRDRCVRCSPAAHSCPLGHISNSGLP